MGRGGDSPSPSPLPSREGGNDLVDRTLVTRCRKARERGALAPALVATFQERILSHYRRHKRPFPWRETRDPYHIVVSEVMLQQTQTDRVAVKFPEFIAAFPTVSALAAAPLAEVLRVWQGMGYNRRAVSLKRLAETVCAAHGGAVPRVPEKLVTLPGIGPATAASIAAYAFNRPTVFIETNIRAVYIHFFFADGARVRDDELVPLVTATLYRTNPSRWYNALMDYGVMLKKQFSNPARRSHHHRPQSRFEGSRRQVRGRIVRHLLAHPNAALGELASAIGHARDRVAEVIGELVGEGMVSKSRGRYVIA